MLDLEFSMLRSCCSCAFIASLSQIFIDFCPIDILWDLCNTDDATWPWDYLQQAAQAVAKGKVSLRYIERNCSRDTWNWMHIWVQDDETWSRGSDDEKSSGNFHGHENEQDEDGNIDEAH